MLVDPAAICFTAVYASPPIDLIFNKKSLIVRLLTAVFEKMRYYSRTICYILLVFIITIYYITIILILK